MSVVFFFQAEDGIRDLVRSRGLGDVYKRQRLLSTKRAAFQILLAKLRLPRTRSMLRFMSLPGDCLLYTSDAADERSSVDLGGRRIIKKKKL